jgi:hypothetical protein
MRVHLLLVKQFALMAVLWAYFMPNYFPLDIDFKTIIPMSASTNHHSTSRQAIITGETIRIDGGVMAYTWPGEMLSDDSWKRTLE